MGGDDLFKSIGHGGWIDNHVEMKPRDMSNRPSALPELVGGPVIWRTEVDITARRLIPSCWHVDGLFISGEGEARLLSGDRVP